MTPPFFDRVAKRLADYGSIPEEDQELCAYGLQQGLVLTVNLVTTLIIGLAWGMVWHSVVFLIAYVPLRSYAGGYHAKTPRRCYLLSILLIMTVLALVRLLPWTIALSAAFASGASILILELSPVATYNKPLDSLEIARYGQRTRLILLLELGVLGFALGLGWRFIVPGISMALVVLSIMLVLGSVQNRRAPGRENP
jgi:accessory gene regulator B